MRSIWPRVPYGSSIRKLVGRRREPSMKRWRWWLATTAIAFTVAVSAGVPLYWLHHQRLQDEPELLYAEYEEELQDYAGRLAAGEVVSVEGRGFGNPQYLIDHGARYCTKHG